MEDRLYDKITSRIGSQRLERCLERTDKLRDDLVRRISDRTQELDAKRRDRETLRAYIDQLDKKLGLTQADYDEIIGNISEDADRSLFKTLAKSMVNKSMTKRECLDLLKEILASFRDHIAPDVTAGARLRLARHYAKSGRLVEARAQMKLLPELAQWPELAKRSQIEQARILVREGKAADARKLLENVADTDADADLQPLRVEAAVEAGKLALAANDAETARKYLDKSVKLQHQLTLYDNDWTAEAKKLLETLPAAKPAEAKK